MIGTYDCDTRRMFWDIGILIVQYWVQVYNRVGRGRGCDGGEHVLRYVVVLG